MFTSLAAFAAAAALVLCLVVCGELFEKPDTLRHAALMMTDLDNLKTVNDTYGHDWGDIYLRQPAHSLRQGSPGGTMVARPSGGRTCGHRRKGRRGGTPEGRAGRSRVLKSKKYRPLYWHRAGTEGDFLSIFTE